MRDALISVGADLESIGKTFTSVTFTVGDLMGSLLEQSSLVTDTRLCLELTSIKTGSVLIVVVKLKLAEEPIR